MIETFQRALDAPLVKCACLISMMELQLRLPKVDLMELCNQELQEPDLLLEFDFELNHIQELLNFDILSPLLSRLLVSDLVQVMFLDFGNWLRHHNLVADVNLIVFPEKRMAE